MDRPVLMRRPSGTWIILLAGLAGPGMAYSAGANASATASIIAPTNASSAVSTYQLLFNTSTGSLSIRINGAPARVALLTSACSLFSGIGNQCNSATTFQVASDGRLDDDEGVSISLSQSDADKTVLMAMLAFN
jgi:hypothetical protein